MGRYPFIAAALVCSLVVSGVNAQCPLSLTSSVDVGDSATAIATEGGIAIVGRGGEFLTALDVSSATPVFLGNLIEGPEPGDGPFFVNDIEMVKDGDCCADMFVAAGEGGLHTYSVDLQFPAIDTFFLSAVATPGPAMGVAYSEEINQVVLVDGESLRVYTSSSTPALQVAVPTPRWASHVAVDDLGDFAYVADNFLGRTPRGTGPSGIQVVDLIGESLRGQMDTGGFIEGIGYARRHVFVAVGDAGVEAYDVSSADTPTLVGSLPVGGYATGIEMVGSVAYVTDATLGLSIIDVSDPSSMQLIGSVAIPGTPSDVATGASSAFTTEPGGDVQGVSVPNFCFDVVNETQNVGHVLLQEAIDLADPGDLIRIGSTTLGEADVLLDKRLSIIGRGRGESIIDTSSAPQRGRCMDIRDTPPGTVIRGLTFRNGDSDNGAGVRVSNSSVIFEGCDFFNNLAFNGVGGAAFVTSSDVDFQRCRFFFNFAQIAGAIAADGGTSIEISGCVFGANGSTIVSSAPSPTRSQVPDLIFGGLGAELVMTNSTIARNGGPIGVLIDWIGHSVIAQSILWDNDSGSLGLDGPRTTVFNSIFPGATGKNFDVDPLFADDKGLDFRLGAGSPAIDAGFNTVLPRDQFDLDDDGDTLEFIPFDVEFQDRRFDDPDTVDTGSGPGPIVDIGALEYNGPQPCSPADLAEPFGTLDFDDVLAFVIAFSNMNPVADLSPPFGVFDFGDVLNFLGFYSLGCP